MSIPILLDGFICSAAASSLTLFDKMILDHCLISHLSSEPGHAKILVGLDNSDQIAKKIVKKNLSVRQSENLVRLYKFPSKLSKNSKDSNITKLEREIMEKIGLKTQINNKKNNKGSVTFDYRDLDQLNHLIDIIKKYY